MDPETLRRGAPRCARERRLAPRGALSSGSESPGSGARRSPGPFPVPLRLPAPHARSCAGSAHPRNPSRAGFQKTPAHSPAFFGRESRRFAASPEGGVGRAERYKYGRRTVASTPRRRRSARAP